MGTAERQNRLALMHVVDEQDTISQRRFVLQRAVADELKAMELSSAMSQRRLRLQRASDDFAVTAKRQNCSALMHVADELKAMKRSSSQPLRVIGTPRKTVDDVKMVAF